MWYKVILRERLIWRWTLICNKGKNEEGRGVTELQGSTEWMVENGDKEGGELWSLGSCHLLLWHMPPPLYFPAYSWRKWSGISQWPSDCQLSSLQIAKVLCAAGPVPWDLSFCVFGCRAKTCRPADTVRLMLLLERRCREKAASWRCQFANPFFHRGQKTSRGHNLDTDVVKWKGMLIYY